jgi:hypothetical protein
MKTNKHNIRYILVSEAPLNCGEEELKQKGIHYLLEGDGSIKQLKEPDATEGTINLMLHACPEPAEAIEQTDALFCLLATLCAQHPQARVKEL